MTYTIQWLYGIADDIMEKNGLKIWKKWAAACLLVLQNQDSGCGKAAAADGNRISMEGSEVIRAAYLDKTEQYLQYPQWKKLSVENTGNDCVPCIVSQGRTLVLGLRRWWLAQPLKS